MGDSPLSLLTTASFILYSPLQISTALVPTLREPLGRVTHRHPYFFPIARMSARAGFRFYTSARQSFARSRFGNAFKRQQTTASNPAAAAEGPQPNVFQRMWTSEVGIKTVHFWAPVMKWGVVLAGATDFLRPAEKLSLTQNMALLATGSIWTRWCFVIRPQNMLLAAVNFCLFCVGLTQCSRIFLYHKELTGSASGAFSNMKAIALGDAKKVETKAVEVEKQAEKEVKAHT